MYRIVFGLEENLKSIFDQLRSKTDKKELDGFIELLNKVKDELSRLLETASEHGLDLGKWRDKIKLLEVKIAELGKELARLKGNDKIDEDEWQAIRKRLEGFKREVDNILSELRDLSDLKNLRRLVMELQAALEGKLDKEEFERWKAENDFNQIISGMLKKFADKNEMLNALKKLEARIAILEDLMREGRPFEGAEDALLAKKPLGGWSCASCQKDLINLEGMRVQYYPWAKLPQRNPADRIAKVGQGFSRMLSMLKPEIINKSQHIGEMKKGYEEDLQPPIDEEDTRAMGRSHGQGFSIGAEVKRPSTAKVLPHIQRQKVSLVCDVIE
jgi:hypothetical protein